MIGSEQREAERLLDVDPPNYILSTDLDWIREICESDYQTRYWASYFFCKSVLGYADMEVIPHLEMSEFISCDEEPRRLFLCPRDSLKTSLVIGEEIRQGLIDPHQLMLHMMDTEDKALEASNFVDDVFRNNKILRTIWPHRIPDFTKGWTKFEKTLPRQYDVRGPTWRWAGAGSSMAGQHYHRIYADDLIGEQTVKSDALMDQVLSTLASFEPLLVKSGTTRGQLFIIGTVWRSDDAYVNLMGEELAFSDKRLFRAEGDPRFLVMKRQAMENGVPFWEKRLNEKELEAIRVSLEKKGRGHLFWHWYFNSPVAPDSVEVPDVGTWEFIKPDPDGDSQRPTHIRLTDLSGKETIINASHLFRTMTVDIASKKKTVRKSNDAPAILVCGSHPQGYRLAMWEWEKKANQIELANQIIDVWLRFQRWGWPIAHIGIEDSSQQYDSFVGWFVPHAQKRGVHGMSIKPLKHKNIDKHDRMRDFAQRYMFDGSFYTHHRLTGLAKQAKQFPNGPMNLLDCLAYQPQIWIKPSFDTPEEYPDDWDEDTIEAAQERRRPEGYGG